MLDGLPPWQTTNGTALSTATTATISPLPAGTDKNFPIAGGTWYPGMTIRVWAAGFITTTTTSTTLTVALATNVNLGSTYVTLATTAGITTGTTAATGLPWWLSGTITCTAIGSSGNTMSTQARLFVQSTAAQPALSGLGNVLHYGMPAASGAAAAAVDTTQVQGIALRGTLAGANATIQCTQWDLESWN